MKFGENLKKLRKSNNLSQEELADKVKVSRQSVSKWETGEAYPEMNNILQLCKIFHCNINSLVNDNIVDLDSLDEEIKMSVVKFKEDKQKQVKGLSTVICVVSRIAKVFITIGIVLSAIITLLVPVIGFNVKVNEPGQVKIFTKTVNYKRLDSDTKIVLTSDKYNHTVTKHDEVEALNIVLDYIEENNLVRVAIFTEVAFICLIITLSIMHKALDHLDKLFTNIGVGDTPFTMENVTHIKKIAYMMILLIIFPAITGMAAGFIIDTGLDFDIDGVGLLSILVLFGLSYIFEYGYYIQQDSNGKMYGDVDE